MERGQLIQSNPTNGTWVLVTLGPSRILGRVHSLGLGESKVKVDNEVAVEQVLAADLITLMPALDFFSPLRPMPALDRQGRPITRNGQPVATMGRDPFVATRDFALKPYPVHVRTGGAITFDFVSQMDASDQATYHEFITIALGGAREESAQKSNIALPTDRDVRVHGR
jgi:hypothetical protein